MATIGPGKQSNTNSQVGQTPEISQQGRLPPRSAPPDRAPPLKPGAVERLAARRPTPELTGRNASRASYLQRIATAGGGETSAKVAATGYALGKLQVTDPGSPRSSADQPRTNNALPARGIPAPTRQPPERPNKERVHAEASPRPMPEALGPSARKTDAEVLNTIYDLARDAGEKHAAHSRHNDAREKALEKVKRGKQNSGQAGRALAQAESKVGLAQRALNKAESAKTNGTATGQNPVEKAQEGLKTAKDEFARLKAKFDVAIDELENDEVRLGALELSLAAAKTETLTANEALKEAIGSQQFDFDAMSATDLARLSLVLVDHPDAKKDAAKQLTASAQRIEDAVLERFTHPSPETIASVAQASRDRSASRALANAISFMKPRPWAELFMAVQGQANRLVDPADPFIEELMGKIGGMEPASMKFLDERIENMAPHWRDAYV